MSEILLLTAIEIFTTLFIRMYCEKVLWKKEVRPVWELSVWIGYFVLFNLATYAVQGPVWYNMLVFLASFFLTVRLLYANSNSTLLGVTVFLYLSGMCSELVVYFGHSAWEDRIGRFVLARLVWFCIAGMVSLLIQKYRQVEIAVAEQAAVFFVPVGSMVILSAFYQSDAGGNGKMHIAAVICVLAINIFTYYLYEKMKENMESRMREEVLGRQCAYYLRQNEEIRKWWKELAEFRHDVKQRYLLEQSYLKAGDLDALAEYLEENLAFLEHERGEAHTGNVYIDSLLNYKAALAAREDIRFEMELKIPADAKVNAEDLDICLGNLLDNATEAVARLMPGEAEKEVNVKLEADGTNLFLCVRNPFSAAEKSGTGYRRYGAKNT